MSGPETELDDNRRIVQEVRENINNISEEERCDLLDNIYNKWIYKSSSGNIFDYGQEALNNFGLDPNNLLVGQFEDAYKRKISEITYLHLMFMRDKMPDNQDIDFEEEDSEIREIKMKFNKIFQSILDAKYAIKSFLFLESSMSEEEYVPTDKDVELYRFIPMDYSDMTPYQKLLLYLLEQLQHHEYRRYNGDCYKQFYTKEGCNTHSWKKAMSLKQFINNVTRKETNPTMWKYLTHSKDNVKASVIYLTDYIGSEFEDVVRDRHVFSFTNGIYIAKKYNEEKDIYYDEWIPYGSKTIGSSIAACKYFDKNFDDKSNIEWFDIIKTYCKHFKQIMDYQDWPEDVQKWLCIMIGRNMYDLGELEEWQVLGYLLGQAGSGKSYGFNTPVLMYNGEIKMVQNLKKGDVLMGDDSTPRNVLSRTAGVDMMYKVKQKNGMDYMVNGLHELCLKMTYCNKGNEYRIINGQKYKKNDIVEINVENYMKLSISQKKALKGYKVPIEFDEKPVPVDPYILGLWLGDGTSAASEITNQDAEILKYLANNLSKYDCYLKYKNGTKYGYRINSANNKNYIWDTLKLLDLVNNKHIPDVYKINSRENRLQLLAGILDTDGSYQSGVFDLIQKNNRLSEDIEYLVKSLGFYTKISKCKKGCMWKGEYREGIYNRMCISGNLDEIPTKIKRKQAFPRKQVKDVLNTGIEIEKYEADYFYGVQLDGNHRLMLGDFTVGHNSTILTKVVKLIYESCDVGVLSNNIEKKFGLSALSEKFMFVGPEIKGNLSLEQSEFQSLISGEDIQIAEKHKLAKSVVWKVPGFMAGNEVPSYTDNAGSVSRRLLVFKFDKKVQKGDTRLGKKLLKELPYIMQACNKAYHEAVNNLGETDIWNCVPEYFKKTKEAMAENTNALTNFLKSDKVKMDSTLYVRERIFVQAFNEHCHANNLGNHKWSNDYYLGPFETFNIRVEKNEKRKYPNEPGAKSYHGSFIFGCDLSSDLDGDGFEDPEL